MTLEKAIKILNDIVPVAEDRNLLEEQQAIKLGKEALKREKRFRFMHPLYNEGLLPGEE